MDWNRRVSRSAIVLVAAVLVLPSVCTGQLWRDKLSRNDSETVRELEEMDVVVDGTWRENPDGHGLRVELCESHAWRWYLPEEEVERHRCAYLKQHLPVVPKALHVLPRLSHSVLAIELNDYNVDREVMGTILKCRHLSSLSLCRSKLDRAAVKLLFASPHVRDELNDLLLPCDGVPDADFAELSNLRALTSLRICESSLTKRQAEVIARLPALEEIRLVSSRIEDGVSAEILAAIERKVDNATFREFSPDP